jgi:hypothetical protein
MTMLATTLTPEQQELRKGRVTSSRIVKLYEGKALAVFNDMMGLSDGPRDNSRMKAGRFFELPTLQWAAEERGWTFVHQPGTTVAGRYATSPDAVIFDPDDAIGEVKFRGADQAHRYANGEATEQEMVQSIWHMGVTGIHRAHVIVALGGSEPSVYPVAWDEEMWLGLREIADRFLRDHIDTGRPPPMDASDAAAEYLRAKFPRHSAPLLQADDATTNLALELRSVRAERERLEAREGELTNVLKSIIGDAEGVAGPGFKLTWKATKGTKRTDWEAVAHELGASTPVIDRYTTTSPGSRRFVPTWKDN